MKSRRFLASMAGLLLVFAGLPALARPHRQNDAIGLDRSGGAILLLHRDRDWGRQDWGQENWRYREPRLGWPEVPFPRGAGRYAGPPHRPPGWDQGRKNGWGGCDVPPGLAKKMGCRQGFIFGRRSPRRIPPIIIPLP